MSPCPYCLSEKPPRKDGFIKGEQRYLCKDCGCKYTLKSSRFAFVSHPTAQVKPCAQCGQETLNPKFCSSSCAAIYNNTNFPKRKKKTRYCKYCGNVIPAGRTVCDDCNPNSVNWMERTLSDIHRAAKYQVSAHLRTIARSQYEKANLPRVCANCGYDKHVEICHVRAINSFPEETPVAVINDLANLVALCPNCHWEFDHDLLLINNL